MAQRSAETKPEAARAIYAWAVLLILAGQGFSFSLCPGARAADLTLIEHEYNVDEEMPEPKVTPKAPAEREPIFSPEPLKESAPNAAPETLPDTLKEQNVDDEEMPKDEPVKPAARPADKSVDKSVDKAAARAATTAGTKTRRPPPIHVTPPTPGEDKGDGADTADDSPESTAKSNAKIIKPANAEDDFGDGLLMHEARRAGQPAKAEPVKAPEENKTEDSKAKLVVHTDISGQFSYILPNSWRTYAIPMQHHEVLTYRDENGTQASISFMDGDKRSGLESSKEAALKERKDAFDKFIVVSDKEISLPGDQKCVRVLATANIDEQPCRQVIYIIAPKKHFNLIVTMTVAKSVGDKYDRALLHIVNSISTK